MFSSIITTLTLNPAIDRTVTIPEFTPGAVNRVDRTSERAGGKGINVAVALAGQGQKVAALGFLGRENEAVFKALFKTRGIEDRCLRLPGHTRVGIKIVDPVRKQTTDINFPGLAPSAGDLGVLREQIAAQRGGWCVMSGSLPPGVPADIYGEFIGTMKNNGVITVLDTSGEALRGAVAAGPHIMKPNVHELEMLTGRTLQTEDDIVRAARELIAGGVELVVVSRGADGACFVTAERVVTARPPETEVGSTVGAGDAMVAGVVASRILGLSLTRCARLATAFSLSRLTRGDDDMDSHAIVEAFLPRVQVTARA